MTHKEEYLGDGCYVSFDGWQLRLRAPRENGDHVVYLEPQLMRGLIGFAQRAGMVDRPPRDQALYPDGAEDQ